jgi:beta-galactosidase/beta-glucuronidase
VLWSLGNESGSGPNLGACRRLVKRADLCARPVQYEGGGGVAEGNGCSRLTDVICPMYTPLWPAALFKGATPCRSAENAHRMQRT